MTSFDLPTGSATWVSSPLPAEAMRELGSRLGARLRVLRFSGATNPATPAAISGADVVLCVLESGAFGPAAPPALRAPAIHPLYWDRVVGFVLGAPLASDADVAQAREAIELTANQAWEARAESAVPLHRQFRRAALKDRDSIALIDGARELSRFKTLVGAIALARALRPSWKRQRRVGLLLPPGLGGALVNLAAAFAGKTAVNLNYTLGPAAIESVVRQSKLKSVLTSRRFLERIDVVLPEHLRFVYIEEILTLIGPVQRALAYAAARWFPESWLERFCGAKRAARATDIATLLFSSGSTGEPKGVPLTHANIEANARAALTHLELDRSDRVLGILPIFHAFGTTILWVAVIEGLAIAFYPDPLDARGVAKVLATHKVTVAVATPTFLQLYLRKGEAERFTSLRLVLAGAERLQATLAQRLSEEWSCQVAEGYGTTECSPIVCVGRAELRSEPALRPPTPRGSVGQALPGVALRLAPPDADQPLASAVPLQQGLLWVRGPNVMHGYLDRPELSACVLRDGWYCTGDIAELDADRNLRITDRLSRFSKIAGEMVPHGVLEQALQNLLNSDEMQVLVTALPCPRKGERLVVLYTFDEERLDEIRTALSQSGLPALSLPHRDHYLHVASLPLLGSGKADLRGARSIAAQRLESHG